MVKNDLCTRWLLTRNIASALCLSTFPERTRQKLFFPFLFRVFVASSSVSLTLIFFPPLTSHSTGNAFAFHFCVSWRDGSLTSRLAFAVHPFVYHLFLLRILCLSICLTTMAAGSVSGTRSSYQRIVAAKPFVLMATLGAEGVASDFFITPL